jgi:RecB family endonuclease NucS
MAIYEIGDTELKIIPETKYSRINIREREDLQRLLKSQIEIIAPGCMVISEEFGNWDDSRRRIDLLCLDKDANLVVVELKRTDDGGHMDLQAIRYAAMISTMTFENAVAAHKSYLLVNRIDGDAEEIILNF